MWPPENAYGVRKRMEFVAEEIRRRRPGSVLDVGCGSGMLLTRPLAELFPECRFVGIDSDPGTIAFANEHGARTNLRFLVADHLPATERFHMIIASEVIEHVESPVEFLSSMVGRLEPGGLIFMTLPNGYGPFEFATLLEVVLRRSGVLALLKRRRGGHGTSSGVADTLAVSPHINFFSFGTIRAVIRAAGLQEIAYRPRTWLCGFGFDSLLRTEVLLRWNAAVADRLPPWTVSDWMFLLERAPAAVPFAYTRGAYARLRRRWNERLAGIG